MRQAFYRTAIGLAVDENIAARWLAVTGGKGAVGGVGVIDVEREMIAALRITRVDDIAAFGRFFIAFKLLMPDRRIAKFDIGEARHFGPALHHDQHAIRFIDQDEIALCNGFGWCGWGDDMGICGSAGRKRRNQA